MKKRVTGLGGIILKPKIQKQQKHGTANTLVCQLMTMAVPSGGKTKKATRLLRSGRLLRPIPPILNPASSLLWLILGLKTLTI